MPQDEIRRAVLAVLAAVAPEADLRQLGADAPLRAQVDLDSVDWLNVLAGIAERLAVDIADADAARLASLDEIVAHVAALKARPAAVPPADATALPRSRHLVAGRPVTMRPIGADDLQREKDFVGRLSPDSRYERFMVTVGELPQSKLRYLTDVDQVRHVALAATIAAGGGEDFVGVARYIVDPAGTGCEFAVAVADDWQGTGIAGVLMHALLRLARARGLRTMEAFVLATNTRMLKFARQLGFTPERHPDDRDTLRVVRAL